jgi:hypothetical protein
MAMGQSSTWSAEPKFLDWAIKNIKFLTDAIAYCHIYRDLGLWPDYGHELIKYKGSKLRFLDWAIKNMKFLID